MSENLDNLGIDFGQLSDSDILIDSDTGQIVTQDNIPGQPQQEKEHPAEVSKEDKELMIEVDTKETGSNDDPADGADASASSSSTNQDQNVLNSLAKALYEQGVISELDEEKLGEASENDASLLIDLIKGEIDKNVAGYKESLPERIQKVIDNYDDNVPLDVIIGLESTKFRLEGITEEQVRGDDELAKILIEENYKRLGMTEAKIKKRIQQFDDLGQLQDEAVDALTESQEYFNQALEKEREAAQKKTADAEQARIDTLEKLKEKIDKTESFVPGIKLSSKEKDSIYESMTKVVDKDKSGTPMNKVMVTRSKNPMGFEQLLHYYHSLGLFNIDDKGNLAPDISKIKAGAKTSAMDELNSALKKSQPSFPGSPAREPSADREALKANIEAMKGIL